MDSKVKKICFIAETPYQVYNSINLYAALQKDRKADIFIGKVFADSDELIHRVSQSNVFSAVFSYVNFNRSIRQRFDELFIPQKYLEVAMRGQSQTAAPDLSSYDEIYLSSTTYFSLAMIAFNKNAGVIFYDDGIGSYLDVMGADAVAFKRRLCYYITGARPERLKITRAFLYCPEICLMLEGKEINKLNVVNHEDEEYKAKHDLVFPYSYDPLYEKRIIYLAQPSQELDGGSLSGLDELLLQYGGKIVIRPHPREADMDHYHSVNVDNSMNQWEIIAEHQITDEHILVGLFSTAQVVPKMLFDKEPYVIFTLSLGRKLFSEELYQKNIAFIEKVRSVYRNPEKIIVPETTDEINTFIQKALGDDS